MPIKTCIQWPMIEMIYVIGRDLFYLVGTFCCNKNNAPSDPMTKTNYFAHDLSDRSNRDRSPNE